MAGLFDLQLIPNRVHRMSALAIAIDGPAGAGKSTVSKELARRTGYSLLDTGAMYRAVTVACMKLNLINDDAAIAQCVTSHNIEIRIDSGLTFAFVDGEDVTASLRLKEVTALVSRIAAVKAVRDWAVNVQRNVVDEEVSSNRGIILEGRDIGTTVLPNADCKFFLTASDEKRAERRAAEVSAPAETILAEIKQRDALDSEREISPLRMADDAVLIDATDLTVDEVINIMLQVMEQK